jgi:hypothetical protein
VIRFCSPWLVWWANSSPFSQNAAVQESVVHLDFISCFKCCLGRCHPRQLLLFRHFPQSSHIKSLSEAWNDVSITVILLKWEIHDISNEDLSNLVYFCFHEVNTCTDFKRRNIKIIYVNWSTYVRKNEYINLTVV